MSDSDRLDRIEAALLRLTEATEQVANHTHPEGA